MMDGVEINCVDWCLNGFYIVFGCCCNEFECEVFCYMISDIEFGCEFCVDFCWFINGCYVCIVVWDDSNVV